MRVQARSACRHHSHISWLTDHKRGQPGTLPECSAWPHALLQEHMVSQAPFRLQQLSEVARAAGWTVRLRKVSEEDLDSFFGMQNGWDLTAFCGDFRLYISFEQPDGVTKRPTFRWASIAMRPPGLNRDAWVRYSLCIRTQGQSICIDLKAAEWLLKNPGEVGQQFEASCEG